MKKAEYEYIANINCSPAPSRDTSLAAVPRGGPTAEDERHRHRPIATWICCRRYRLPDLVSSFCRFKLRLRGEMDARDDLLLRYLRQFALPPSLPRRHKFEKFTPKRINWRTHRLGEAVGQPWGPQFQAWHWSKCGELGPSLPSRGDLFMWKYGVWLLPGRPNIRWRRRPPLLIDDEDDEYAPVQAGTAPKAGSTDDVLLQNVGESGRGPRSAVAEAVAEAVASPLGVQPSINSAGISSPK